MGCSAPHLCRKINNFFFISPRSTHHDLKAQFLYKTLINWVSNESVGFPAFNFVVCVTNFAAADFHLKDRSLTHVSFYKQLQTSWLEKLDSLSVLSYELFYSPGLTYFSYQWPFCAREVKVVKTNLTSETLKPSGIKTGHKNDDDLTEENEIFLKKGWALFSEETRPEFSFKRASSCFLIASKVCLSFRVSNVNAN